MAKEVAEKKTTELAAASDIQSFLAENAGAGVAFFKNFVASRCSS